MKHIGSILAGFMALMFWGCIALMLLSIFGVIDLDKPRGPARMIECRDSRDGEVFQFSTHDIIESGMAIDLPIGSWIKFKDSNGKIREIFPSHGKHLKCGEL